MVLSPSQIDKISEELRSFHRAETRTKKIRKLEPSFYHNVVAALETLSEESNRYLLEKDIGQYIKIKERTDEIEREFKALFQKRFEKIAYLSVYELDSELMSSLTPEEKEFIITLHNMIQDEFHTLLLKEKDQPPQVKPVVPEKKEIVEQKEVQPLEFETSRKVLNEFQLVLILEELPTIAQPERDYVLHQQDLVYLPSQFAEMLVKRKVAEKINF